MAPTPRNPAADTATHSGISSMSSKGAGPLTPPSDPEPEAKTKRRRGKRDDPPRLQFVTATDPSQFKDEKAKRSVRSQAMIHYKNRSETKKKRKQSGSDDVATENALAGREPPGSAATTEFPASAKTEELLLNATPKTTTSDSFEVHWDSQQYTYLPGSARHSIDADSFVSGSDSPIYDSRNGGGRLVRSSNVTKYEDSDGHEDVQMRVLVGKIATLFNIGDGIDPFCAIPQYKSPELNSLLLLRTSIRGFTSDETHKKWLPAILSHPHLLLSTPILASSWLDMRVGHSGDSRRTTLMKAETITMIKERLRNAETRDQDSTLMVILHLLAGEMWSCDEKTLRTHETGVARFITERGGMASLSSPAIGEVAAACCYHCDIFCELSPLPLFHEWQPREYTPNGNPAIPESPLFCPRSEFETFINDPRCTQSTFDLLCDMRDLTDLFIANQTHMNVIEDLDEEELKSPTPPAGDYDAKVIKIRDRLVCLPSAYIPGLPTSNDWVYEACRIAALIYAASIIARVSFSVAADPRQNCILSGSKSLTNSHIDGDFFTTRLTEALFEVLERTDTANIWKDMAGVYYWINAVGAAAARSPSAINMTQQPRFRSEAYAVWVRRCLIMSSTRAMIILVFQHPIPVLMAQKKLLKVQELIGDSAVLRRVP